MKLNLGCADRHLPDYVNVDIALPADQIVDLSGPWPWPDSSIDEVVALDIIEHLPDRIGTMNELHRVLKPGARAIIETPDAAKGPGFWQDPTHEAGWCMNSFQYYQHGAFARNRLAKSYGITAAFKIVSLTEKQVPDVNESVWKIAVILEAMK